MSCEGETVAVLREAGFRLTPQRLLILEILRHNGEHLTAAEICEQVRRSYPYVDISTVYRTLAAVKELRLVAETDLGGGEQTYEWIGPEPHHHLICRACGRVVSIEDKHLEPLVEKIVEEYDFQAEIDHLAVFGLCGECRRQASPG